MQSSVKIETLMQTPDIHELARLICCAIRRGVIQNRVFRKDFPLTFLSHSTQTKWMIHLLVSFSCGFMLQDNNWLLRAR